MTSNKVTISDMGMRAFRQLLQAQRLAALRHDDDLQATLLNLLLRNYFAFNLYDQADKLIAKTSFPDTAGNPQLARWMYYVGESRRSSYSGLRRNTCTDVYRVGRIRAIQLNYTDAHTHLQQAIRRAPNATVAPGFVQTVNMILFYVAMMLGLTNFPISGLQAVHHR